MVTPFARRAPAGVLAGHPQADLDDRLVVGDLGEPALVHDEDAVVQREDLVEVLAEQQDARAALGRLDQVRVDRLDGGDVEPARRRGGDEHLHRVGELAGEHELLQVPAGEVRRPRSPGPGALISYAAIAAAASRAHPAEPQERPERVVAVGAQLEVHRDREARRDAGAEAVLGDEADPGLERAARVAVREPLARRPRSSRAMHGRRPAIASLSSRWPLPATPATATISPGVTAKRRVLDGRPAAVALDPQALDLEHRRRARRPRASERA